MKKFISIVALLIASLPATFAQTRWTLEAHGGEVYNVPMPLTIRQNGYPDLKLTARYRTEAFTLPIYSDWRLSRWKNNRSWEFEFIHHKLYLDNTSAEVQKFNISHGFNMIFVNRGFDKKTFHYRVGCGIVLAHPESNIRGNEFGSSTDNWDLGYFLTGPILNFAIGKHYRLNKRFFVNTEAKTTFAYSSIKVAQGNADVYNLAFHLIVGVGYDFRKN